MNVSVQRASLRHRSMAGFVAAYDPLSRLAAESPGFVWHLHSDTGHSVRDDDGRQLVVNVTVWRDYPSLHDFVYRSLHGQVLLRRGEWFLPTGAPSTALWWQPDGERPTLDQALARLRHLREHGPSPQAFSLARQFSPEGRPVSRDRRDDRRPSGGP